MHHNPVHFTTMYSEVFYSLSIITRHQLSSETIEKHKSLQTLNGQTPQQTATVFQSNYTAKQRDRDFNSIEIETFLKNMVANY